MISELDDFLASCDLEVLSSLLQDDDHDGTNVTPPPSVPRKRGRKKSNIDPATKHELDRIKDRNRCSKYRARQRNERIGLQQEVQTLTAKLVALQEAKKMSSELSMSTWQMIAQRELEARQSSEEQQRRLCAAVKARAACIRDFQEMVQRVGAVHKDSQPLKRARVERSDVAVYEVFLQDLDAIYAKTDEVLRGCGLNLTGQDQVQSKRMWNKADRAGFFLFMDNQTMPFDFKEACQTLWYSALLPHRQEDRKVFDGVDDPENTAAFKFRVSNRLATGQVVSVVQRVVTRRYLEEGRMVLVWQSLMEGEGMFIGMQAGETGWDVLTPSMDASKPGTVMRTCISHTPVQFGMQLPKNLLLSSLMA
ncbi:unnamed protein product [Phytophthora lilii]|uniref:Unnamed protein product n=1 Tax=Phytophthora lilii TaxID=2077276 RepID=A0A9W6YKK7_9STRA|nr:unnamed protein product [Phytophthora lilii]